jgi:hypothetical protein
VWSGTTASRWTTAAELTFAPVVFTISSEPLLRTLRVWKPLVEGPYSCIDGNCWILHLAEVRAWATAGKGALDRNLLPNSTCTQSSATAGGEACRATLDGSLVRIPARQA